MAETAGLVLSIAGLWQVFSSCIEIAEHVNRARNLGFDYEARLTTLVSLERRLRNCQIIWKALENSVRARDVQDVDSHNVIARLLAITRMRLEDIDKLLQKYDKQCSNQSQSAVANASSVQSSSVQETSEAMRATVTHRQQTMSIIRKAAWAITDQKKLKEITEEVEGFVSQMEKLSEGVARRSSTPSCPQVCTNSQIASERVNTIDTLNMPQTSARYSTTGHTYHQNNIGDRCRILQGNIGLAAQSEGRDHAYVSNIISGDAKVIQGNTAGEDMSSFWGD
jgi:hypothetical protein